MWARENANLAVPADSRRLWKPPPCPTRIREEFVMSRIESSRSGAGEEVRENRKEALPNSPEARILHIADWLICLFLAAKFSTSPYYIKNGDCDLTLSVCFSFLMHFVFFLLGLYWIKRAMNRDAKEKIKHGLTHADRGWAKLLLENRYSVLLIGTVIFLFWLPTLIALYPGTLINDSWGQLSGYNSFLHGQLLYDHHPILTTLVIGFSLNTLEKLTGNWHIAFFLYVLAQALITSLSFARLVSYCYKTLRIGAAISLVFIFLFCCLPMFPASAQTISKDAMSGWIFVLFSVQFIETVRTGGQTLERKKNVVLLTILGLLCAATKKVNTYVCIFSVLCLMIAFRRYWKKLLIPISVIAGIMLVAFPVLDKLGYIKAGGKQEMLSVPFQQSARYYRDHADDVTEDEERVLSIVLGTEDLGQRYDPLNADPVKGFSQRAEDAEYLNYLKVWFAQGIRHPVTYLKALDSMLSGWFSSTNYIPLMNMDWHSQLNPALIPEEAAYRNRTAGMAAAYQRAVSDLYKSPIASFFLSYGFFAALIPAFIFSVLTTKQNRKGYWVSMVPMMLCLILGCFLSPYSNHFESRRYLYPVIYTEPLILAFSIYVHRKQSCAAEQ